jgi:hypothetical protein
VFAVLHYYSDTTLSLIHNGCYDNVFRAPEGGCIITGHTFVGEYTQRFFPQHTPEQIACPCGKLLETVAHVLLVCPRYTAARRKHLFASGRPRSLPQLFENERESSACFVSWKRQVPAPSRGQSGSLDRQESIMYRALPTKTAPPYLVVHPLPIAINPGPLPKHTCLSAIRSTRDRLCTFCCMRAE